MIKNWKKWLKAAIIRATKTMAQTALGTIGGGAMMMGDVTWPVVISASIFAGVLSILTSFAGLPEVKEDTEGAE